MKKIKMFSPGDAFEMQCWKPLENLSLVPQDWREERATHREPIDSSLCIRWKCLTIKLFRVCPSTRNIWHLNFLLRKFITRSWFCGNDRLVASPILMKTFRQFITKEYLHFKHWCLHYFEKTLTWLAMTTSRKHIPWALRFRSTSTGFSLQPRLPEACLQQTEALRQQAAAKRAEVTWVKGKKRF